MRTTFASPRYWYTFGPHDAAITVRSGEELCVVCPDSDNALADGTLLPPSRRQQAPGLFEGNPMAGPIHVDGAEPGDAVAVDILEIELDRDYGQTGLAPGHGLLPVELLARPSDKSDACQVPRHLYRWTLDHDRKIARLENPVGNRPIQVPLDPFVGCIGVCPPWGQSISTLFAGPFGGNMDVPLLKGGSTIHLPVWHPGAGLLMGDIHAAQGHGEIIGGAIETSGRIHCRIRLLKNGQTRFPRITTPTTRYAIGIHGDTRIAIQQAYAHLLDWLEQEPGLNRFDAYNLISQAGCLVMGGLVASPYPVAAGIEHRYL